MIRQSARLAGDGQRAFQVEEFREASLTAVCPMHSMTDNFLPVALSAEDQQPD